MLRSFKCHSLAIIFCIQKYRIYAILLKKCSCRGWNMKTSFFGDFKKESALDSNIFKWCVTNDRAFYTVFEEKGPNVSFSLCSKECFGACFSRHQPFIFADKLSTLKLTDWFAHIVCACLKRDFFPSRLAAKPSAKYSQLLKTIHIFASYSIFFSSVLPNLFTVTLVNRCCASSANLMSEPFLIYCECVFFSSSWLTQKTHTHNWWQHKHGRQNYHIFIHGMSLLYEPYEHTKTNLMFFVVYLHLLHTTQSIH